MRMLILMRGAPGCGKSTWIKEHGLSDYALSADAIRGLFVSLSWYNPASRLFLSATIKWFGKLCSRCLSGECKEETLQS